MNWRCLNAHSVPFGRDSFNFIVTALFDAMLSVMASKCIVKERYGGVNGEHERARYSCTKGDNAKVARIMKVISDWNFSGNVVASISNEFCCKVVINWWRNEMERRYWKIKKKKKEWKNLGRKGDLGGWIIFFFFLMEFIAILVKVNRCCEKKKFWDKNIFYLIKII